MEKRLQVKNLKISFKTSNGKVQAVRGINFDLNKGETLAIVGESGSGKSVTSKAILGILAGNSIIEDGEIIYDGQDLLKIKENDFHKIRGDKIAMIFQDPMSSLNPIVKIGKQLTEAMILKGKARQKESRLLFGKYMTNLEASMKAAYAADGTDKAAEIAEKCNKFIQFEKNHTELELQYNKAYEAALEAIADGEAISFEMSKNAPNDVAYRLKRIGLLAIRSIHRFVVKADEKRLREAVDNLNIAVPAAQKGDYATSIYEVDTIVDILKSAAALEKPDFFCMGYYECFGKDESLLSFPVSEMNSKLREFVAADFMEDFVTDARAGIVYNAKKSHEAMEAAIKILSENKGIFQKEELVKEECFAALDKMNAAAAATVDPLSLNKDNMTYTFRSGFKTELDRYFDGKKRNVKELARVKKEQAKYDRIAAKDKEPDWNVVPASLVDFDAVKSNMLRQIDGLSEHYKEIAAAERNFDADVVALIDFLKEKASGSVYKVTKSMAREKAIRLMNEVGIHEPRKRYNQYPFEFSGGMRQRIVIAIALAANPDILICDEPTTALDVTIQAQILELINKLKAERNLSVIFITHDLGVVANMADRIAVMYAGKICEYGTSNEIFYSPAHPYTWALLSSMPDLDTNEKLDAIPGTPPDMIYPPKGDAFAERNRYAMKIDFERQPPMFKITETHYAATWLLHPDAPKVDPPAAIVNRIERMKKRRDARNGN